MKIELSKASARKQNEIIVTALVEAGAILKTATATKKAKAEKISARGEYTIKVTSSTALISKYSDILSAIEKSFQTNLDDKSITKLVKLQLNKMPSWEIINQSLDGSDSSAYTYSYPKKQLYVMKPNEETIIEAQNKIKEILNAN